MLQRLFYLDYLKIKENDTYFTYSIMTSLSFPLKFSSSNDQLLTKKQTVITLQRFEELFLFFDMQHYTHVCMHKQPLAYDIFSSSSYLL